MSCYLTDFDLQFPKQDAPITDFVHILGMSSLKQFTTCFLMKGDISGSGGTPFSYAVPGSNNELLVHNYNAFQLFIGGEVRYELCPQTLLLSTYWLQHIICNNIILLSLLYFEEKCKITTRITWSRHPEMKTEN